ncbi:hypothetical protein ACMXFZ_001201 [Campylobacter jejuni]|nr:hypothetical protein [Campylobacter coli]EAK7824612.1 hypothetical protein [Campylobacter jejuni]EAK7632246.1 hypothetical protein [Campylobacter coli]ECK8397926.1 hypothetical protein [Campylobacter jejuni]ECL3713082.1 hypothetical protein [Campylobacter jejuni]
MSFSKISCVKKLFSAYIKYLQIDLANSLLNDNVYYRNIEIIIILKDIFLLLQQSEEVLKKKKEKIDKMFEILDSVIEKYNDSNKVKLEPQRIDSCDDELFVNLLENEEFVKLLAIFSSANRIFRNFFNGIYIEKEILQKFSKRLNYQGYLFVQPLLEANNALSHLVVYIYNGSIKVENELKNIDKAKNHLYRAAIDYYKMFIRFSIEKSKNNRNNIFESFYSIREQEFLLLGKDLMKKNIEFINPTTGNKQLEYISEAYRKLFIAIKNDLDSQKSLNSQTQH